MATVGGATAFKAICGSSPATAATFASVAVPEMDRYNYDKKLSTGIVASVGTLGNPHAAQRYIDRIWNYYGTIDREAIFGRDLPGTHHRSLLYPDHLWMVPDQSLHGTQRGKVHLEGTVEISA
jgi:hypothetical protein